MRLILTDGSDKADWKPRLRTRRGEEPYAILSHRWHEDPNCEVLFGDIAEIDASVTGSVKNSQYAGADLHTKVSFNKLQGAAQRALADGYSYIWVDTCCIDKNSSAELSEAINSMFKWYGTSGICYVYLADCTVSNLATKQGEVQFRDSQWWKRGWTLQELLAPRDLIFFTSTWAEIGRRDDLNLTTRISELSGIDINVVNGTIPLQSISVAQRMSWAATRVTSRVEDIAYSLMGIFQVNMPLLYGEGEKAFLRLQQEIMNDSDDETIFAWVDTKFSSQNGGETDHVLSGLLATHPSAFSSSRCITEEHATETSVPFAMTNSGLSITLPLEDLGKGIYIAWLRCIRSDTNLRIGIYLKKLSPSTAQYARIRESEWACFNSQAWFKFIPLYVKQHHYQIPAYTDLDDDSRIRLIQVLRTEGAFGLQLRLLSANVNSAKYTALSYIWDNTGENCTVLLNSEQVRIPKRIFTFLQSRRKQSMSTLYWIDAVCIHQNNLSERQKQVRLMAKIYQNAFEVRILLDNIASPKITSGYKMLWSAATASKSLAKKQPILVEIAQHPYWKRAWILQEVLLARDIVLELNSSSVTISSLRQAYYDSITVKDALSSDHASTLRYLQPFLHFARSTARFSYDTENSHPEQLSGDQRPQATFEELFESFHFVQCMLPHDRVYAFINICDLGPDFFINYAETREELLLRVMAARGDRLTSSALSLLQKALQTNISDAELSRLRSASRDVEGDFTNQRDTKNRLLR